MYIYIASNLKKNDSCHLAIHGKSTNNINEK